VNCFTGVTDIALIKSFFRSVLRFLREADMLLLILSLISSIFGFILISSILSGNEVETGALNVQLGSIIIGIAFFVLFSYIDIDIIADKSKLLFVFSVLFILTLYFWGVGSETHSRRAWLRFFGIGIQPAEIVKITFIIITAKIITNYKERKTLNSFLSLVQLVVVFLMMFALVLLVSEDIGTSLVYLFIFLIMLFIGGVKLRWFALGGTALTAIFPFFWFNFLSERQRVRILVPFIPELEPDRLDLLWQSDQSVRAISSGGFFGQGLGNGRLTQAGVIPEQHTDFIFSAAGEELGFVGCIAILLLLVAIIVRCIIIGLKSNNTLGMLVCIGIAAKFIAQTFENIGMSLGLLPVIGVTLPFFSYGGSSMVTCFAAMGIVSGIKLRQNPSRFRDF